VVARPPSISTFAHSSIEIWSHSVATAIDFRQARFVCPIVDPKPPFAVLESGRSDSYKLMLMARSQLGRGHPAPVPISEHPGPVWFAAPDLDANDP
jgi:hypothetical protein